MPDGPAHSVDRRMALAREWDELVEQVRQLDGFEDFLRPPRLETLLPAAEEGPVVILNVSRWRCDALVVQPSGVILIELPELTQQSVIEQVNRYLSAVGTFQQDEEVYAEAERAFARTDHGVVALSAFAAAGTRWGEAGGRLETELDTCLRWMWDNFAAKVLDQLGFTEQPQTWPRLWWCPTGALTLLPIHAAGHHDTPGAAVLDRVISSYTPTLRALLEARGKGTLARDDGRVTAESGRMLFVGLENTPGQPQLPNVRFERELVERLLPAERLTVLPEQTATRAAVLEQLSGHTWLHLSCHGDQDLDDPSHGRVHVYDGALTVVDFSAQQYRGEFAYLSGCKTAVGGVNLPDEAITLAAALHYTGYRHVIATLWTVLDQHAAQITEAVYEYLIRDGMLDASNAAQALHMAVRGLRDEHRDRPSVWTPFAHTGP